MKKKTVFTCFNLTKEKNPIYTIFPHKCFLPWIVSTHLCTVWPLAFCTVTFGFPNAKKNSFHGNYMRKYGSPIVPDIWMDFLPYMRYLALGTYFALRSYNPSTFHITPIWNCFWKTDKENFIFCVRTKVNKSFTK